MTEPLDLNRNPLNRLAKEHLLQLGQSPDPEYLYSLQLVRWILEEEPSYLPSPADQFAAELKERASEMLAWKPENAQTWLTTEPNEPLTRAVRIVAETIEDEEPRDAAATLVEILYRNLQASMPSLRVADRP